MRRYSIPFDTCFLSLLVGLSIPCEVTAAKHGPRSGGTNTTTKGFCMATGMLESNISSLCEGFDLDKMSTTTKGYWPTPEMLELDFSELWEDSDCDEINGAYSPSEIDFPCTAKGDCLPTEIREYDMMALWEHFKCHELYEIYETSGRLVDQDSWIRLRELYRDVVGLNSSDVSSDSGFSVEYYVRNNLPDGKGRGVFAFSKIPKGTLIWSTKQTARFSTGHQYRLFLAFAPPEWVCDLQHWGYIQDMEDGDPDDTRGWRISMDLDDGSLMNANEYANAGCTPELGATVPGGCKQNCFALKDIEADEEITVEYTSFAIIDGRPWSQFGINEPQY